MALQQVPNIFRQSKFRYIFPAKYPHLQTILKLGHAITSWSDIKAVICYTPTSSQTCPVCLENIENPVTTKCGHIFCYNCIQKKFSEGCYICYRQIELQDCKPLIWETCLFYRPQELNIDPDVLATDIVILRLVVDPYNFFKSDAEQLNYEKGRKAPFSLIYTMEEDQISDIYKKCPNLINSKETGPALTTNEAHFNSSSFYQSKDGQLIFLDPECIFTIFEKYLKIPQVDTQNTGIYTLRPLGFNTKKMTSILPLEIKGNVTKVKRHTKNKFLEERFCWTTFLPNGIDFSLVTLGNRIDVIRRQ